MSGLLGGLLNASQSLAAQQAGVETASRNISNVNNPNYARQRVQIKDRIYPESMGVGDGATVTGIQQIRDSLLDASVTREISNTAVLTSQQSALQRAQANLGESIDTSAESSSIDDNSHSENGISSSLNDFFNGWEELSANPADPATRQLLLQKAQTLSDKLNTTDSRLASLQGDLTTQINTDLQSANTILQTISKLNTQIAQAEIQQPGSALDLRDQRQAQLESLAKYVDFSSSEIPGSNGQIAVTVRDQSNNQVNLVSKNVVHPLSFDGTNFTAGTPAATLLVSGGSLAGNLTARDGAVQNVRNQITALAQQLTKSVNAVYNPSGTGQDFFQASPTTGIMAVNTAITSTTLQTGSTGEAGANDLALAVGALATQKFSTASGDAIDGSPSDFLANSVTGLGAKLNDLSSKIDDQNTVQTMVTNQRDAVSGVSMDEELSDLMRYQRAYQASSKVLSTIDTMLSDLINSVGSVTG